MTAYLNAVGVTCALGRGQQAVRGAMWHPDSNAPGEVTDRYTQGRHLLLGTVADLPEDAALDAARAAGMAADDWPVNHRSRNNTLLLDALAQIRDTVDAAIQRVGPTRVAVIIGTSTSGIREGEQAIQHLSQHGALPQAYHYGQQELGSPALLLARVLGTRGPAYAISTACSSGAKAMAAGARLLRNGLADVVIAGGVDTLCAFTVAGFSALESVSATRCNPLSANRNGINLGEGAALFVMSREAGPVRLAGWGESSDAYHVSAPDPKGEGARLAMRQALQVAGIEPGAIDYVNLHGTATPANDIMEAHAVADLLGNDVPVSSTKPLTGHTLAAAGAIEAALSWLTLADNPRGQLPPHWWDGAADAALPTLHVAAPGSSLGRAPRYVLSNSFAFGGSNCTLVMGAT
ncbi:beta-ketoacyl-ACP synthase [Cupriavidus plantarum]|uniref:3-oxoacyl-[acyl-carrier-protein] synthase-1 n=1 Tax=Cupriavidus plantarum TaxID=942865 RepID=A0A316F1N4_9BURK|nr:beta-ketoacyl-ACP synthase [Cupriavidus plantarum]PWK37433.1 3-oxoacyl-[acyl-carrier-protein] synthase-1 [Cupriavidus plantarum]